MCLKYMNFEAPKLRMVTDNETLSLPVISTVTVVFPHSAIFSTWELLPTATGENKKVLSSSGYAMVDIL